LAPVRTRRVSPCKRLPVAGVSGDAAGVYRRDPHGARLPLVNQWRAYTWAFTGICIARDLHERASSAEVRTPIVRFSQVSSVLSQPTSARGVRQRPTMSPVATAPAPLIFFDAPSFR
jgi:hypothetical protein